MDPKQTLQDYLVGDKDEMNQAAYDYNRWVSMGGFQVEVIYKDQRYMVSALARTTDRVFLEELGQQYVSRDEVRVVK